ncbi:hypothetical protein [Tamlana crocina]|uniref:Addiction module protein n=1 Tax=Tamlana crocina TaxID=393006 RepID=A0ABX1DAP0_9FLAO|nr:hypothetical protein [Tamlana crocina]NJX15401.1 hypothetical protein [Tamlana crocina]
MNIEATKLELMHLLLQTQKESLLKKLKAVFEEEQVDWWNDLSEHEQKEVETGLKQAEKGNYAKNETVMKRFEKWR